MFEIKPVGWCNSKNGLCSIAPHKVIKVILIKEKPIFLLQLWKTQNLMLWNETY